MKKKRTLLTVAMAAALAMSATAPPVHASSHMDAPAITFDDAANTTDVYAFVSQVGGVKYLTTALSVYPFEEPGIGPNKYNFDDNVLYEIHVATGKDVGDGKASISYQFQFNTSFKNSDTILQSYLGIINDVDDANQNLTQRYSVTKVDYRRRRRGEATVLGTGVVPPNNQGIATPEYNTPDGEGIAKDGVATESELDKYTRQAIANLNGGYRSFAGQREDGFYGDIQAIFDLLQLRDPGKDSQGGFNVHTMVLQIPVDELGGDQQVVGVYATTSRRRVTILHSNPFRDPNPRLKGDFIQVGRQGNPLFCEALIGIKDKDLYNRTVPERDQSKFKVYALEPELAKLLNAIVLPGSGVTAPETGRTDLAGIFIPDLIKVDLSTSRARLAGGGPTHPTNPDDSGFSRLSIFGNDVLTSTVQSGFGSGIVPGGWPNGRRFGDDVLDIAVSAVISDLRTNPPKIVVAGDKVNQNDAVYNKVMPYAGTPLSGRNHSHP